MPTSTYLYVPFSGKVPYLTTLIQPLSLPKSGIMTREREMCSYPQSDRFNRHSWLDSMWGRDASNIRGGYEPIWVGERSYIGQRRDQYETVAAESCSLLIETIARYFQGIQDCGHLYIIDI